MNELAKVPPPSTLMTFIERAAMDERFDVAKFEQLLRLQREVEKDQARQAFNAALARAQSEMRPVAKRQRNPHLGTSYASLADIDDAIREAYTSNGFSVRCGSRVIANDNARVANDNMVLIVTCTIAHDGGHEEHQELPVSTSRQGAQGGRMALTENQATGSAITYGRRYLLGMMFNVQTEEMRDDDGESTRRPPANDTRRAPPEQRMTIADWLASLELALLDCKSRTELDRLLDREDTLRISSTLKGEALERFNAMKTAALTRHPPEKPEEKTTNDDWPGPPPAA